MPFITPDFFHIILLTLMAVTMIYSGQRFVRNKDRVETLSQRLVESAEKCKTLEGKLQAKPAEKPVAPQWPIQDPNKGKLSPAELVHIRDYLMYCLKISHIDSHASHKDGFCLYLTHRIESHLLSYDERYKPEAAQEETTAEQKEEDA